MNDGTDITAIDQSFTSTGGNGMIGIGDLKVGDSHVGYLTLGSGTANDTNFNFNGLWQSSMPMIGSLPPTEAQLVAEMIGLEGRIIEIKKQLQIIRGEKTEEEQKFAPRKLKMG